jgi:hypothetical protein
MFITLQNDLFGFHIYSEIYTNDILQDSIKYIEEANNIFEPDKIDKILNIKYFEEKLLKCKMNILLFIKNLENIN